MRRRSQYSYGSVPMIHHSRSKFDLSYSHKTTLNVGDLVPLYCQEIYPGDSFKCDANVVARVTSSFLKPVMDNLFCDIMFFFVPSRTLYDKWSEIFGENNDSAWARQSEVSAPYSLDQSSVSVKAGSLASYLGLPVGATAERLYSLGGFNVLPFRAYAKIYNEWYRDENLVDPVLLQTGEWNEVTEVLNDNPFSAQNYFGMPAKVAKMHDYFTQLAPSPQKSLEPVSIGAAVFPASFVPVVGSAPVLTGSGNTDSSGTPLQWRQVGGVPLMQEVMPIISSGSGNTTGYPSTFGSGSDIYPSNLHADFTSSSSSAMASIPETQLGAVTVNDLRLAFQMQKMLERDSVFGTRFTEYLQGHFGVTSPDARLQRSEFLGGRRFPISVLQATQTSQATTDSPLGNVAGWSLSNGRSGYTKGFTEHGFVIGMFCVRQFHTYQQGVERFWWRHNRIDYLDPLFTSIGYQPVFTKELYATGSDVSKEQVLGYAPAFEDLRCRQNRISGQLATGSGNGLDSWHFADSYDSAPVLGQEWIEETPRFVDRTLTVPSETVDNFIFDVYFKQYAIRVMPTYGMPGLVDHH